MDISHLTRHISPGWTYLTWMNISHLPGHISPGWIYLTLPDIYHPARHFSPGWTYLTWTSHLARHISPGWTFLTWPDISHLTRHISPDQTYLTSPDISYLSLAGHIHPAVWYICVPVTVSSSFPPHGCDSAPSVASHLHHVWKITELSWWTTPLVHLPIHCGCRARKEIPSWRCRTLPHAIWVLYHWSTPLPPPATC